MSIASSIGQAAFKLSFELSPIIFTGGIAALLPGGALPIIAITETDVFTAGILSGGDFDLGDTFANFVPAAGATLADYSIGEYPFANQAVAANAIIANPLRVSLRMICPVKDPGGYAAKLVTMTALQAAVTAHATEGGTYTVLTPTQFYTNCILKNLQDITGGGSKQAQTEWRWDFEQPLLTQQQAQQAFNSLMSKIDAGTQVTPNADGVISYSGQAQTVNTPPSLAAPSIIPSASGTAASGVAGSAPGPGTGGLY